MKWTSMKVDISKWALSAIKRPPPVFNSKTFSSAHKEAWILLGDPVLRWGEWRLLAACLWSDRVMAELWLWCRGLRSLWSSPELSPAWSLRIVTCPKSHSSQVADPRFLLSYSAKTAIELINEVARRAVLWVRACSPRKPTVPRVSPWAILNNTRCRRPLSLHLRWPALLNVLIATLIYLEWKIRATTLW